MSIRLAKFADHWRGALNRDYQLSYDSLQYTDLRSLHDGKVDFAKGLTVIVGGNGVGKSTLVHAAVDVLTGPNEIAAVKKHGRRLVGSGLRAEVTDNKTKREFAVAIDGNGDRNYVGGAPIPLTWLDPAELAAICQQQILRDSEFGDLLDANGSRALKPNELFFASSLIGKDYTSCTVWEIPDYAEIEVFPYFRVESSGVTYGSESMGVGELSLFICAWFINRASAHSIVVIEEPETHVSPRSQDALMNMIAWHCNVRGLWVIVTTHSPAIIKNVPLANVRLLSSHGGKSTLLHNPSWHEVGAILGGVLPTRGLLLVEDNCARCFAQAILEVLQPDLAHQLKIGVAKDGESQIESVLVKLPRVAEWPVIGVFDGDHRHKAVSEKSCWPHVFLPGNVPPEQVLREVSRTQGFSEKLAHALDMPNASVVVAMDAATGLDHHDWLQKLCAVLKRSEDCVVRAISRIWIQGDRRSAEVFAQDLQNALQAANK